MSIYSVKHLQPCPPNPKLGHISPACHLAALFVRHAEPKWLERQPASPPAPSHHSSLSGQCTCCRRDLLPIHHTCPRGPRRSHNLPHNRPHISLRTDPRAHQVHQSNGGKYPRLTPGRGNAASKAHGDDVTIFSSLKKKKRKKSKTPTHLQPNHILQLATEVLHSKQKVKQTNPEQCLRLARCKKKLSASDISPSPAVGSYF